MSFRGRLILFFVAIVVLPMIAVALLVIQISEDSRDGKADARIGAGLEVGRVTYDRALAAAGEAAERIGERENVRGGAITKPNAKLLRRIAAEETADPAIAAVHFYGPGGKELASAGSELPLAISSSRLLGPGGEELGRLEVAGLGAEEYALEVAELTGAEAAVRSDEGLLAASTELESDGPSAGDGAGEIETADGTLRAAALALNNGPPGAELMVASDDGGGFDASQPVVLAVLVGFLGLAFLLAVVLVRALQGQVAEMFGAAQRIGGGDFSGRVPVEGDDELAGLAREFNKMSDRLAAQVTELKRQREELDESVQRIGDAFASGLDRTALLGVVLETALAACAAESGRIVLRGADEPEVEVGAPPSGELAEALERAAHEALDRHETVESGTGPARAIAHPLSDAGDPDLVRGTMAVGRIGGSFDASEREVLRYLVGQAAVSVENIRLHERVSEQALSDELTGLANARHFRDWIEREAERVNRFGGELSMLLLDIDDFKRINDTYGHLQGDAVLEQLGRVLRLESRGIDEVARYGGEEFVLVLPGTPRDGALEVAERVRESIEATIVPGVEGNEPLQVTASFGVATMPEHGADPQSLIAAADAALYEAKRAGKNRVALATAKK